MLERLITKGRIKMQQQKAKIKKTDRYSNWVNTGIPIGFSDGCSGCGGCQSGTGCSSSGGRIGFTEYGQEGCSGSGCSGCSGCGFP